MATRVNTRFVMILSAVLVSLTLTGMGFWYIFVFRNATRLIRWGDEYAAEQQYREAAEMYKKAVARELRDVKLLYKWAEASSKVACTNFTEARLYFADMQGAYNQCILVQPENPEHVENLMKLYLDSIRDGGIRGHWFRMNAVAQGILDDRPNNALARRYHSMSAVQIMRATSMGMPQREAVREHLTTMYGQDPADREVAHALATWYLEQSQDTQTVPEEAVREQYRLMAERTSEESLRVDPGDVQRQLHRANVLATLDKTDEAMETAGRLEQAILTTGGQPWLIREVADLLVSVDKRAVQQVGLGETTQGILRATRLIDASLTQRPDNLMLMSLAARLRQYQGDIAAALELYRKIYETKFSAPPLEAQMAGMLARQAGFRYASLMIAEAERLPDEAAREARLVDVEVLVNRFKEETADDDPELALIEGKIYMVRNQWAEASQRLDDACSLFSDSNVDALYLSGIARRQTGQSGAAEARFRRVLELAPGFHRARFELARLQMKINRLPEAHANVQYLLANNSQDPQTQLLYAQYLENSGKTGDAIKAIQQLNPGDNPELLVTMTKLYQSMGDSETAIRMAEAYFKRDPTEPRVLLQLIDLAPNHDAARQYIETARSAGATRKTIELAEAKLGVNEGDPEKLFDIVNDPFAKALGLFDLFLRQGEIDKAAVQLAEARKLQPNDAKVVDREFQLAMIRQDMAAIQAAVVRAEQTNADLCQGLFFRGRFELLKGEPHRAVSTLAEAVARRPVHSEGHRMLGEAQLAMGRANDAAESFTKALAQNPRNAWAQLGMARVMQMQQRPDKALEHMRLAADLSPESTTIVSSYLDFEERHGNKQTALDKRLELAKSQPKFAANRRGLALLYSRMDRPDQALAAIDGLIAEEGMNWENARTKAQVFVAKGDAGAGRSLLQKYLTDLGDNAQAQDWILMARYLRTIGDLNGALAAYRMGVQRDDPKVALAKRALAGMLADVGEHERAMEQYDELVRQLPDDLEVATQRIETLVRMNQIDKASTAVDQAIAKFGQRTPLLLLKAMSLRVRMAQAQQADEQAKFLELQSQAMALLNRAVEGDPTNAQALLSRAELKAMSRETLASAVDDAKRALERKGDLAGARMLLAAIYDNQGQTEAAAREYSTLLSMEPTHQAAREALFNLLLRTEQTQALGRVLSEAVELFPSDYRWWLYRGITARTLERNNDLAVTYYTKAFELAQPPQNTAVLEELVRLMLDIGRTDDAMKVIDAQMAIVSGRPLLQAMRGRALALKGQTEAATNLFAGILPSCRSIEHAVSLASEMRAAFGPAGTITRLESMASGEDQNRWVQIIAARFESNQRNYEQALARLDRVRTSVVRPGPESEVFDQVEAEAALNLGRTDQAVAAYRKVVEVAPNNVGALNNLAYLLAETMSKPLEALPFAERAKDLAPTDSQVLDTVGWVQYKAGRRDEAFLTLRRSVEIEKHPDNCFHLAQLLFERQSIAEARNLILDAEKLALAQSRQDLLPAIRKLKDELTRAR